MNLEINLPSSLLTAIGNNLFLFSLLLLGVTLLASITVEIFDQERDKHGFCLRAWKFTGSLWLWILLLFAAGAGLKFYPEPTELLKLNGKSIIALWASLAVLSLMIYHFTSKLIKVRFIHLLPGLIALILAGGAVYLECLTKILPAWQDAAAMAPEGSSKDSLNLLWWLSQNDLFRFLHLSTTALAAAMLWFMIVNAGEKEGRRQQKREYYFQAAAWAGKWLLAALLLALIPLGRDYYLACGGDFKLLLAPPRLYWLGATVICYLLGLLLLLKITLDGLVNRRATLIITFFLVLALAASKVGTDVF